MLCLPRHSYNFCLRLCYIAQYFSFRFVNITQHLSKSPFLLLYALDPDETDKIVLLLGAERKLNIFLMVIISTLVSVLVIVGIVALYKYWKKRKRQLDQARFLKLFEDPDDLNELDNF